MESYGISNTWKKQIFLDFCVCRNWWLKYVAVTNWFFGMYTPSTFLRTVDFCSRIHSLCNTVNLREDVFSVCRLGDCIHFFNLIPLPYIRWFELPNMGIHIIITLRKRLKHLQISPRCSCLLGIFRKLPQNIPYATPPFYPKLFCVNIDEITKIISRPANPPISTGSFQHEFGFRSIYRYREERDLYMGFAPPENEVTAYQGKYKTVDHIFYSTHPANWEFQR